MDSEIFKILFMIVVIAVIGAGWVITLNHETGTGSHECTIYAMEKSGMVWQTYKVWVVYDGQMVDGGDVFTIDPTDTELAEDLRIAMVTKQKVHIGYRTMFNQALWQYGSPDVITNVVNATG